MRIFAAAQPGSLVHRLDPRVRVVAAFAFAILVCLCERMAVLESALAVSLLLTLAARTGDGTALRRLLQLNLFMLLLAVFLPLSTPGSPLLQLGPLAWSRQGLRQAGLIALRANTIMIALMALLGTMESAHLGFALNRLGFSEKLTHVLLFMIRYIDVIHREYHRLTDAMRLRGFRPGCNRHTFRTFGYLIGLLLVRSVDRAERVVEAMKCRGFRGRFYVLAPFEITRLDIAFATTAAGCMILLGWMEWR